MKKNIVKTCPYCKTKIESEDSVVACNLCEMPHHKDCWIENAGCTTFGCMGTIDNPPANSGFSANPINICLTCGNENILHSAFCVRCGNALQQPMYQQPTYNQQPYQPPNPVPAFFSPPQFDFEANDRGSNEPPRYKSPEELANAMQQQPYAPQPQSYAPQPQSYVPQPQSYAPQPQTYAPQPQTYAPQPQPYAPQPQSYAPQPQSYAPQPQSYAPQPTYGPGYSTPRQFGTVGYDSDFGYFVGNNADFFHSKFENMKMSGSSTSWNWAAFLFTGYWFIYRKMYGIGFAILGANLLFSFFGVINYLLSIGVSIFAGIMGNNLYMKYVDKELYYAKSLPEFQKLPVLSQRGGTNGGALAGAIGAMFILQFIILIVGR